MTIRHLRIFVMVAECKTMSLAAEKMFLSQPTVSQAVRELEEHYGGLLFERLSRHLYITEMGEKLLANARDLLRQYDFLEEQMLDKKLHKKLRVGASLTVGTCLLPSLIVQYKKKWPQVDLFACVNNTKVIEKMLLTGQLDMALVEGKIKSQDLICSPVLEDEMVLVCAKSHPFAGKETLYFHQLEGQNFVMREEGSGTRELFENDLRMHKVQVKMAWEAIGTESIRRAVLMDGCLCVIAYRLVETEVRSGQMYMFRGDSNRWKRSFSLVYHKDKYMNEGMEHFMESLKWYQAQDKTPDPASGRLLEG